jgi:hypothetical protein
MSKWFLALLGLAFFSGAPGHVTLEDKALVVDGVPAPFLFGAEVQYFRARGGPTRNVPRAEVMALWDKLLDRVAEAHMNMVTFYVPWDFHEPKEGVFDFDGTLDQDGDGKPDYPARDLKTFLAKVEAHGIKYVSLRPGPYINAEWGPTGFGAIPLWFIDHYPEALAVARTPSRAKVATFAHPAYRDHVAKWFAALESHVLRGNVGLGHPITLLQIDNETNFFWDSVYERDLSPTALARYRAFVTAKYGDVGAMNRAYGGTALRFDDLAPPAGPDDHAANTQWHYDWYAWHDDEIRDYYRFLRATWEGLGIKEPDVLFTRCDSFNAPERGLLPRLDYGESGGLAFSTLNIYPKTSGTQAASTLNVPMKGAHDAALLSASHAQMYGAGGHWLMSSETVGGWFAPTEVSLATRQHTYASLAGNGVKAEAIYYFHEGFNWNGLEQSDSALAFDAPLDKDMNPRPSFALLAEFGKRLAGGLGDLLVQGTPVRAPVLVLHDDDTQYSVPNAPGTDEAARIAAEDTAGVFGLFRAAGALPAAGFVDRMGAAELASYRLVVWRHPGYVGAATTARLQAYVDGGGTLLVIGDGDDDGAHDLAVVPHGTGRVVRWADDPSKGWNDDAFLGLTNASASLARADAVLADAGVARAVRVHADGQEPFVHAWLVAGDAKTHDAKTLLFVENFTRVAKTVGLTIDPTALAGSASGASDASVTFAPAWLATGDQGVRPTSVAEGALATTGARLPVSPDGVDVWELSR